ncbi:MAG: MarR family winged helix-turn-helix transcriptional regulator [Actinomycetota bacterium]
MAGQPDIRLGMLPRLLGWHLRSTQVAVFRHFARTVTAEVDITPALFGMLQVIAANPGLTPSALAEAMGVDRSAIVKVVDQLERRGLIAREPSPHDGRSHCLPLTTKGRAELARMEALVLAHEEDFTKVLTPEERQVLIGLLARLHLRNEGRNGS